MNWLKQIISAGKELQAHAAEIGSLVKDLRWAVQEIRRIIAQRGD